MEGGLPKADQQANKIKLDEESMVKLIGEEKLGYQMQIYLDTCVSWGCPAVNGMQGIPFSGCNKKLNGLLSTMTIRLGFFDRMERSFTCSRYSL